MPIKTESFPNCCSARILYAFDGSSTSAYGERYRQPDEKELAAQVTEQMVYSQRCGYGIITAMLTTEQVVAAKVLKELGWTMSMESSKIKHSETKLQLWAFACKDSAAIDVVVTNPFAKIETPEEVVRAVDETGNRMLSSYLRPPVNRWIPVTPGDPMPEIIRNRRVSIRTELEVGDRWAPYQIRARIVWPQIAQEWSWERARIGNRITHVYIHAL